MNGQLSLNTRLETLKVEYNKIKMYLKVAVEDNEQSLIIEYVNQLKMNEFESSIINKIKQGKINN